MNFAPTGPLANALHQAIREALRDSTAYHSRGILVSLALTANTDLRAPEQLLHRAAYTLFAAMPWRLVPDSTLFVATYDVEGGIELVWEGREESIFESEAFRSSLREGPHGDLVDIALTALRSFCAMREGRVEVERAEVPASPRFPRGVAIRRRVTAFLPTIPSEPLAADALPQVAAQG